MQVVLLERIGKLGQMGDVVSVKEGFARNFLLPRGKALRATKTNIARFEQDRAQREARNLELKKEAEAVNQKLDGSSFIMIRTAGDTGQLYGSVASRDVADAVTAGGFSIARQQVALDRPIKSLGLHPVSVVLHPEVAAKITVNVARSQDEAERQSRGEDVTSVKEEGPEFTEIGAAAMFEEDALPREEAGEPDAEASADGVEDDTKPKGKKAKKDEQ